MLQELLRFVYAQSTNMLRDTTAVQLARKFIQASTTNPQQTTQFVRSYLFRKVRRKVSIQSGCDTIFPQKGELLGPGSPPFWSGQVLQHVLQVKTGDLKAPQLFGDGAGAVAQRGKSSYPSV